MEPVATVTVKESLGKTKSTKGVMDKVRNLLVYPTNILLVLDMLIPDTTAF